VKFKYNKDWTNIANLDKTSDGNNDSGGGGITIADYVVDFVIPGVDAFEFNCSDTTAACEVIISGENGENITITIPRDSTGQLQLPYVIKDKDGNVFIIEKDTTDEDNDMSVTSASYASVKGYACFIGYALDINENDIHFCNTQNVDKQDELLNVIKEKIDEQAIKDEKPTTNKASINCEISVKSKGVYMSWYQAKSSALLNRPKLDAVGKTFHVKLNGEIKNSKNSGITITDAMLNDGENICELSIKESGKITIIAKYILRKYTDETYRMEIERTILPPNKRKDVYIDNSVAGTKHDVIFNPNEEISLAMKVIKGTDTTLYSNEQTQWYVNDVKTHEGTYYNYIIQLGNNPVIKAVTGTNEIRVILDVKQPTSISGNINPNYSGVTGADRDSAIVYYENALPRCRTGDVGTFISNTPKPITVNIEKHAAGAGGLLMGGHANDGAFFTKAKYEKLDLKNINTDGDGAIIDAKLVSKLNSEDEAGIKISVEEGKPTQKTEILISRIKRLSSSNADALLKMIQEKKTDQSLLNVLEYEIISTDDDISEWVTFHNDDPISIMINLIGLGNDAKANTQRKDFTRLMAHELLHHYWTHFEKFEKLKWLIIRAKQSTYNYILSDGLVSGNAQDSNLGCSQHNGHPCSANKGHERHNPEHSKVCNEQYNY
jgi:hypothetical protein